MAPHLWGGGPERQLAVPRFVPRRWPIGALRVDRRARQDRLSDEIPRADTTSNDENQSKAVPLKQA